MIKILAIDDNKDNLLVLNSLLAGAFPGATILTALSGREGIDIATRENPDVILLDLVMPQLDGYETCRLLKENIKLQRIPVIILTAEDTSSASRTRVLKLGAESFLAKPVEESELTAQVSSMLRIKISDDIASHENERLEALVVERIKGFEKSTREALDLLAELRTEMEQHRLSDIALQHSEEQFRNFYENAPVGLYRTTPAGKILMANRAIYEMLGFSSFEELSARNLEEIGFEPTYMRRQFTEQIEKNGEVRNLVSTWACRNGEVITVSENAKTIRDSDGNILYFDGTVENITVRKQTEDALQKSEQRFRALTQSANDAIITIDAKGVIVDWNVAAEKIFGYSAEEMAGRILGDIIPPRYTLNHTSNVERVAGGGEHHVIGKTVELYGLHKNGHEFPVELSVSEWETDSVKFFSAIIRDTTERKLAETAIRDALVKAESGDRLRKAFMNNISHEIRTPLNGILGFSDLLIQPGTTNEEQLLYFSLLEMSSNRLLDTVTNYMDMALIASGNMKINVTLHNLTDILNLLQAKFLPMCSEKNLGLILDIPANSASITLHSDSELFSKIMTHLLDNAVKFSDKGTITFGFTINPAGPFGKHEGKPPEPDFFVRDTGIGIDKESLSRVFESFAQEEQSSTRDHEGSGLGLSIAQGLVKLLGGSLSVESEKGKGSAFSFTLPCSVLGLGIIYKKDETEQTTGNLKNHVILVAEDDESNSLFIETVLRKTKIPVLVANNGKTAVDLCQEHPEISIVLMDIKMPVMDGLQATREIKSFRKDLPIIALTAYAMSTDEQRVHEAGCDDYLTKPLNREDLMKKLKLFRIIP